MTSDPVPDSPAPGPTPVENLPSHFTHQPNYFAHANDPYPSQLPLRQSVYGLKSFIVGLVVILGLASVFGGMVLHMTHARHKPIDKTITRLIGYAFLGGAALSLVGIGMGVGCLFERHRKKALGIIGLTLNAVVVALVAFIIVLGFIARARR